MAHLGTEITQPVEFPQVIPQPATTREQPSTLPEWGEPSPTHQPVESPVETPVETPA